MNFHVGVMLNATVIALHHFTVVYGVTILAGVQCL